MAAGHQATSVWLHDVSVSQNPAAKAVAGDAGADSPERCMLDHRAGSVCPLMRKVKED